MTLLANKFAQIASKIDATNAQIAALQAKRARDPRLSATVARPLAHPPIASGI